VACILLCSCFFFFFRVFPPFLQKKHFEERKKGKEKKRKQLFEENEDLNFEYFTKKIIIFQIFQAVLLTIHVQEPTEAYFQK